MHHHGPMHRRRLVWAEFFDLDSCLVSSDSSKRSWDSSDAASRAYRFDSAGHGRAGVHDAVVGDYRNGNGRFAVAVGYPPEVGYAVGGVFDFAKALLPVGLLMLLSRRAVGLFVIIGVAWLGLVIYSSLATHATVSSAIGAIERNGTWKMEVRSGTKAELAETEKRLAVLSQPTPPRPKTLSEGLASEVVPPGVWRDSRECPNIHDSRYFQSACQKFLDLRRELAVAQDYEKLDTHAMEFRQTLATVRPVATSDPLPQAFAATLGRLLSLDGHAGVALLLTLIVETMSCLASLVCGP